MKFVSLEQAVQLVPDLATVVITGGGGGLLECDALLSALEKRFLQSSTPRDLRLVHSLGIGDRNKKGINHLAHEGLVRKVIGGHWVWSPAMQRLALEEKIEAYVLPGGVLAQLMREIAAKRPGLLTHVGLDTFVDPRQAGGRMNQSAKDELLEVIVLDRQEWLRYKTFSVDVALLRGSISDEAGNISLMREPSNLESLAIAQAAHNSGGVVIVQVQQRVPNGSLKAREINIPAALVDAVVLVPEQMQSHQFVYDPHISGEARPIQANTNPVDGNETDPVRDFIAARAAKELQLGKVVNFGFGLPDAVARMVREQEFYQTIEHGTYGGRLLEGDLFGFAQDPSCILDSPSQFDFYAGGGLDIAFLGFGEVDQFGNVNVSKLGGVPVGPGGFMDIAQNARTVVFCGTFEAKGLRCAVENQSIRILQAGQVQKFVAKVEQITFSGQQALARGQRVLYVTERAVFELTKQGMVLREISQGIDFATDIEPRMGFRVDSLKLVGV